MKKYTQEDFEGFEVVDGRRICPSGDYTNIKHFFEECSFGRGCSFGEWCYFGRGCSFGEWCSFGRGCSFGEWCYFGEACSFDRGCLIIGIEFKNRTVLSVSSIGEHCRTLTMWDTIDGILFQAGCRLEKEDDFLKAVIEKYGTGSAYEKAMNFLKKIHL